MRSHRTTEVLLAGTAVAADPTHDGARESPDVLRPAVGFNGACLAVAHPLDAGYRSLAGLDLTTQTVGSIAGPATPGTPRSPGPTGRGRR